MCTGQKIIALIEVAAPVSVERFEDHPQLGRFTLRDEGKTIAIGKITKLIEVHSSRSLFSALAVTDMVHGFTFRISQRTEEGIDISKLSLENGGI